MILKPYPLANRVKSLMISRLGLNNFMASSSMKKDYRQVTWPLLAFTMTSTLCSLVHAGGCYIDSHLFRDALNFNLSSGISASSASLSSSVSFSSGVGSYHIDFATVFSDAPFIYTLLMLLSIASVTITIYSLLRWRDYLQLPQGLIKKLKRRIEQKRFDEAEDLCAKHPLFLTDTLICGLRVHSRGAQNFAQEVRLESERLANQQWQKVYFLQDVASIAPMLGLLGTVMGLFYAFYAGNRSVEAITALFDGLGVAIGTTVAGLIVAIVATALQTLLKLYFNQKIVRVDNHLSMLSASVEILPKLNRDQPESGPN